MGATPNAQTPMQDEKSPLLKKEEGEEMKTALKQKMMTRKRMVSDAQAELIGLVAHMAAGPIKKRDVVPEYLQGKDWNKAKALALEKGLISSDGTGEYRLGILPNRTRYKCFEWMGCQGAWTGTAGIATLQYAELILDLLCENMYFLVKDMARILGCPERLFEDVMSEVKGHPLVETIDLPEVLALIDDIRYSGMFEEEALAAEEEQFFSSCYNDMASTSFNKTVQEVLA